MQTRSRAKVAEVPVPVLSAIPAMPLTPLPPPIKPVSKKRGRPAGQKRHVEPIRGGWDSLPHNLGKLWTPPSARNNVTADGSGDIDNVDTGPNKHRRLDGSDLIVTPDTSVELPMILPGGSSDDDSHHSKIIVATDSSTTSIATVDSSGAGGEALKTEAIAVKTEESTGKTEAIAVKTEATAVEVVTVTVKKRKKTGKTKANPYGLTPGITPYPEWSSPGAEDCQQVYDILAATHDDVTPLPPDEIPAPSIEVAGCGEVPSVLDGLMRTVLSGSTTFESADNMLQALAKKYGLLEQGIGAGSVNWNKIRVAEYQEVVDTIKIGGLGPKKAKFMQDILRMVHAENLERRNAFLKEEETGTQATVPGAANKTKGQKDFEILKADRDILSLDHMHGMTKDEAMEHFVRYPGVGVKTAACVTLFCLQKPCLAVDTHVFRMSRWLGWVPLESNEDLTFRHLEVRCSDKLKYGLHQLFIRHGKCCARCNDKSFIGTEAWHKTECPLEHLLNRVGKRHAKPALKKKDAKGESEVQVDPDQDRADSEVAPVASPVAGPHKASGTDADLDMGEDPEADARLVLLLEKQGHGRFTRRDQEELHRLMEKAKRRSEALAAKET